MVLQMSYQRWQEDPNSIKHNMVTHYNKNGVIIARQMPREIAQRLISRRHVVAISNSAIRQR